MSVIATDTKRYSNVVKYEDEPSLALTREVVVVNDAAKTLKLGMLLGKVTATGKYKESVQTAVDGSQNPVAVVVGKDIFTNKDRKSTRLNSSHSAKSRMPSSA